MIRVLNVCLVLTIHKNIFLSRHHFPSPTMLITSSITKIASYISLKNGLLTVAGIGLTNCPCRLCIPYEPGLGFI